MTPLMTLRELADYLRVNDRTVYRMADRGQVPAAKVGRQWRFDRQAIDRWLNREMTAPKAGILVVDDDPVIGLLFEETFREQGQEVVVAYSGPEALECVKNRNFDVIFLDLKMPRMDGAELLGRIRNIRPDASVTIITGYPDSDIMERALERGPFSVMKKPFSPADILNAFNLATAGKFAVK